MNHQCYNCSHVAKWLYMPGRNTPEGSDFFCDDCVPRGCACNFELKPGIEEIVGENGLMNPEEDYYEPVAEDGRKYPCCEYWYKDGGWEVENDRRTGE